MDNPAIAYDGKDMPPTQKGKRPVGWLLFIVQLASVILTYLCLLYTSPSPRD